MRSGWGLPTHGAFASAAENSRFPGPRAARASWRGGSAPAPRQHARALAMARAPRGSAAQSCGARRTPFVSLYVDGRLRGCSGCDEGVPGQRLARAFCARTVPMARSPIAPPSERGRVVAQVSYFHSVRVLDSRPSRNEHRARTHGIGVARSGALFCAAPAAGCRSDERLDAAAFLSVLGRKAGLSADGWQKPGGWPDTTLFHFLAEEVIARGDTKTRGIVALPKSRDASGSRGRVARRASGF